MISKVGEFSKGDMVIYDGEICKIAGFKNRNTVFLENMDKESLRWRRSVTSIGKIAKPSFIPDGLLPEVLERLVADAVQLGFREMGYACKADVQDGVVDVSFVAHRPVPFMGVVLNRYESWR